MAIENYFRSVLTLSAIVLCMGLDEGIFSNTIPLSSLKLLFEPCKNDLPYRLEANVSLSKCVFDCMSRSRCRFIMYRRLASVCGFVDIDDAFSSVTASQSKSICVYTSFDGLDRSILGACADHTCSDTKTCMLTESGQGYKCVESECPSPPIVSNGNALTKYQQVKGLVRYTCKPHFKTIGTRIILCRENATWSEMDCRCDATCRKPWGIDTAGLVDVVGERWGQTRYTQNTVLVYQCKSGYTNNQGRSQINSTCQTNSNWRPSTISCCKPDWIRIEQSCFRFFDKIDLFSREEMLGFCSNESALLYSPFTNASLNFVSEQILKPKKITKTVVSNQLASNIVRWCDANGARCGDMWTTGKPNMKYNCTAYGKDSGYKLRTIPCDWRPERQYGFICLMDNYI